MVPYDIPGPRAIGTQDGDIVALWHRRQSIAQQMRYPYETEWVKNWKLYRAYIEDAQAPEDWWRSNVFIPEMFNAVETVLPRIVLGMFSRPEWFSVACPHGSWPGHPGMNCYDYERMVKSLLMSTCRQMKRPSLFEETVNGQRYKEIMGHAWYKLTWDREAGQRQMDAPVHDPETGELLGMSSGVIPTVDYDNPRLRHVSNFRVWADPTGLNEWFIEEIDTTYERLVQTEAESDVPIYKNLDLLAQSTNEKPRDVVNRNTSMGGAGLSTREAEIDAVEGFSRIVRDQTEGAAVKLLQCWGRVPFDTPDGTRWRLQVIANDSIVIRDVPAPTPDLRPPYFASKCIPIPGFVYGDSTLRYAGPLNEQLNRINNWRMDEVMLGIWQQYIGNRNAVQDNQALLDPGGIVWVDTQADVAGAFKVLDRRPVMPEAYREQAVKEDQIQRTTGATASQQGAIPEAQDRSATAFAGRMQLGNERFRLATMYQNLTFKQELLSRMFALLQRNVSPSRLVRIVGTDYQVPIDISMIQDNIDIDIETDVLDLDSQQRTQALSFLLQTTLGSPLALQRTKLEPLLRDTYEAFLNRDGRKYVKSDEEMQAEAMAQAQAALYAGALTGGGPPAQGGMPPGIGPGGPGGGGPPPLQLPAGFGHS